VSWKNSIAAVLRNLAMLAAASLAISTWRALVSPGSLAIFDKIGNNARPWQARAPHGAPLWGRADAVLFQLRSIRKLYLQLYAVSAQQKKLKQVKRSS
jgi:hypothetical protein